MKTMLTIYRVCTLICLTIVVAVGTLCSAAFAQTSAPANKNYEFVNGRWFDGKRFQKKIFYTTNNVFSAKRPARVDQTIDLNNGFVVAPFADAHTHNFDGLFNLQKQINNYLREGVFYAKVQTNTLSGARAAAKFVNLPTSVDVSYSHGALTASYGHGVEVYEGLALLYKPGPSTPEEVQKLRASKLRENDAYYIIDTPADLENKWQKILAAKPDFLKIYLLTTEEFETRKNRTDTVGDRGLDPQLVAPIVEKARAAGLRVSAHVDTVADWCVALAAGVDEMAHLPGYYVSETTDLKSVMLTEQDARETARRKICVVPAPIYGGSYMSADVRARTDRVLKHNLGLLRRADARVAFASDRYGSTPIDDVLHIASLDVFSNLEMLKIWTEQTPQTIFPNRRIGFLKNGYEASFLVLGGNPLENFGEIKNIRMRFKQGQPISAEQQNAK